MNSISKDFGDYGRMVDFSTGRSNVEAKELDDQEFCKAIEDSSIGILATCLVKELSDDEIVGICFKYASSHQLSVETVLGRDPHLQELFQRLVSEIEVRGKYGEMHDLSSQKDGVEMCSKNDSRLKEASGRFNKNSVVGESKNSSTTEKIVEKKRELNKKVYREEFCDFIKSNPSPDRLRARCTQFLKRQGAVEYCSAFSELFKKQKVGESALVRILQMKLAEQTELDDGGGASLYVMLSSEIDSGGIEAIHDLLGNLSDDAVVNLLGSDALSDCSVLINLVQSGDVDGVNRFSRLLSGIGLRLGFKAVERLLMNDKIVLHATLVAADGPMLESLSKMYSNLNIFKGIVDVLGKSKDIAYAIKHGKIDVLKAYCSTVKSIHAALGKSEKKLILGAMRNAELTFFGSQTKEFMALCDENPGFYDTYKSTKAILKPAK